MPRDIYGQIRCGQCATLVHTDQARTVTEGGTPLCERCDYALVFPARRRRWYSSFADEPRFFGLNILELLLAVAIIGGAIAATVPTIAVVFDRLERRDLATYLAQAGDAQMAGLALETVEQGGAIALRAMIEDAASFAGVQDEHVGEFAREFRRYEEFSTEEEQAGFLVRTVDEWKARYNTGKLPQGPAP